MTPRRRDVATRWTVLLVMLVALGVALAYLTGAILIPAGVYGVAFVGGWFAGVWLLGDYRDHRAGQRRRPEGW